MQYTDERNHLRVEIKSKECDIPKDELTRMERSLAPLAEVTRTFPEARLWLNIIHHPKSNVYHVEAKLKLPGETLFGGDSDPYLDSAFQRCVRKLVRRAEAYRDHPDQRAKERASRLESLNGDVVRPEEPESGPLAEAARDGDYRRFRNVLAGYEEWLRKRVGRWIQRYPEAQARVGDELLIGDLVEEVYLNAFEDYERRPTHLRFSEWLDGLIDPSLKALLRNPDEEHRNASLARTVRQAPLT